MIPFLESADGSCQLTVILVEVAEVTVKLVGACEGTGMENQTLNKQSISFVKKEHVNLCYLARFERKLTHPSQTFK